MMNPKTLVLTSGVILVGLTLVFTGCSREPEAPPVAEYTPPPPPPPAPPALTSIRDLMAELRIDDRIAMDEDKAPRTNEARKAVLEFFDAFARGDSRALSGRLTEADRRELQAMVDAGVWERTTRRIRHILIQTGPSAYGDCAVALFQVGDDYQAQAWYFRPALGRDADGSTFEFSAAATPPGMTQRLSGTDWIKAWHNILEEEMELAFRPDVPIQMPQSNLDEGRESSDGPSGGGAPPSPSGPLAPMNPGGDEPAPAPRRPPGIPAPGTR